MAVSLVTKLLLVIVFISLIGSLALVVSAQFLVLMQYGYGEGIKQVNIWWTCDRDDNGVPRCFSVTSSKQCTELSSRLKTVGAFSVLAAINIAILLVAIVAEIRGAKFPVQHLIKIIFGWCIFPLFVACGFTIGTLIAKLCSDPLSLTDRNGSYQDAYYCLCAAVVAAMIAAGAYPSGPVGGGAEEAAAAAAGHKDSDDDDDDSKRRSDAAKLL